MNHWNTLMEEYLAELYLTGRRKSTIAAYRVHISRFTLYMVGSNIKKLDRTAPYKACLKILRHHKTSYHGYGSKQLLLAAVRCFIKWCENNGHINRVSYNFSRLLPCGESNRTKPIGMEDVKKLLRVIKNSSSPLRIRDYTLMSMYAYTGMRRAEVVSLRIGDYNLSDQTISFSGKGGKKKACQWYRP